jgi:hypothetical protein
VSLRGSTQKDALHISASNIFCCPIQQKEEIQEVVGKMIPQFLLEIILYYDMLLIVFLPVNKL